MGDGSGEAAAVFARVPPALIDTMCDSWMRAARAGQAEGFLTLRAADAAACFCGQIMEQARKALLLCVLYV